MTTTPGALRSDGRVRLLGPSGRAAVLAAVLAGCALLLMTGLDRPPLGGLALPWPLVAVAFALAEVKVVHVRLGRDAHSLSASDAVLAVALVVLSPWQLAAAHVLGAGVALAVVRRQGPVKVAFNCSSYLLQAAVAATVASTLVGTADPLGPRGWAAVLVAIAAATVVADVAIATVVGLTTRVWALRELPGMLGLSLAAAVGVGTLGLVGVIVAEQRVSALLLLTVPTALVLWAYGTSHRLQEQYDTLSLLHEAAQQLAVGRAVAPGLGAVLSLLRTRLSASAAEIVLRGDDDAHVLRTSVDEHRTLLLAPGASSAQEQALLHLAGGGAAVTADDPAVRDYLQGRGWSGGMLVPLLGERTAGLLLIAGERSAATGFSASELRLAQLLAAQVAGVLEAARLEQSLVQVEALADDLRHQAFHDPLTGLVNRALFDDRVERALHRSALDGQPAAVVYVDLDDFKAVNDTLGHEAGDRLLVGVAARMTAIVGGAGTVARMGGDEFAVLVESGADSDTMAGLGASLRQGFERPFDVQGTTLRVTASIGVSISDAATLDLREFLRQADTAMYQAKRAGKDRFALYRPAVGQDEQHLQLAAALDRDELEVWYQPVIDLDSGRQVAEEALVRWRHPQRGLLLPGEFLPGAEEGGLMPALGRYVLRRACEQAASRQHADPAQTVSVFVNVSPHQLRTGFAADVDAALTASGLPAELLVLELTEDALLLDTDQVLAELHAIKELGVRLALDDFGTGYSSLSYLNRFPFDVLKIARELVQDVHTDAGRRVADAVIQLGRALGLHVLAEGVETEQQAVTMRQLGCRLGQGYHWGRPAAPAPLLARPVRTSRCSSTPQG